MLFSSAFASSLVAFSDQGTDVIDNSTGWYLNNGNLTVTIWDNLSGGNLLYNETFIGAIMNGSWNVMLGANPAHNLSLDYGQIYYRDYAINGEDVSFLDYAGNPVGRQFFYSPLGDINASFIVLAPWVVNGSVVNFSYVGATAGDFWNLHVWNNTNTDTLTVLDSITAVNGVSASWLSGYLDANNITNEPWLLFVPYQESAAGWVVGNASSWCFQDWANSTSCGGVAPGTYMLSAEIVNPANCYDANWGTYCYTAGEDTFNASYPVPPLALYINWEIKYNSARENLTIPTSCIGSFFNASVYMYALDMDSRISFSCQEMNGSWLTLKDVINQGNHLYEEGAWFFIPQAITTDAPSVYINNSQVCTAANGICATNASVPYQSSAAGWANDSTNTNTSVKVNINNNLTASWLFGNLNASYIQNPPWGIGGGSVTSITANASGLLGGTINTSGSIALNNSYIAVIIGNATIARTGSTSVCNYGIANFTSGTGGPSITCAAQQGTVTSVTCGTGLTGGAITTSGTCAVNSSYNPNSYINASGVPYQSSAAGWVNDSASTNTSLKVNVNNNLSASWFFGNLNASYVQNPPWQTNITPSMNLVLNSLLANANITATTGFYGYLDASYILNSPWLTSTPYQSSAAGWIYTVINSSQCYQETANVSTACGGLNTGSYVVDKTWNTVTNLYDGDWTTYAIGNQSCPGGYTCGKLNITYYKPSFSANISTWQVSDYNSERSPVNQTVNLTIPNSCWNAYSDKVVFQIRHMKSAFGNEEVYWDCFNGVSLTNLRNATTTETGSAHPYEEAMWWNISSNSNITTSASTVYINNSQVCTASNGICATNVSVGYQSSAAGWTNTSTVTSTNQYVGIGTSEPKWNVDVRGTDAQATCIHLTNNFTGYDAGDGSNICLGSGQYADLFLYNYENNGFGFGTGGNTRFFIDYGGDIGIGTNVVTPGANLDVRMTSTTQPGIQMVHAGGSAAYLYAYDSSVSPVYVWDANGDHLFYGNTLYLNNTAANGGRIADVAGVGSVMYGLSDTFAFYNQNGSAVMAKMKPNAMYGGVNDGEDFKIYSTESATMGDIYLAADNVVVHSDATQPAWHDFQVGVPENGNQLAAEAKSAIYGTYSSTASEVLLRLNRVGANGVTYPSSADFALKKHTDDANPNTQLDINLKNTASWNETAETTVMSLRSDGQVNIIGTLNVSNNATISGLLNLPPLASPPAGASEGAIYSDTDHNLYYYNSTAWVSLNSGGGNGTSDGTGGWTNTTNITSTQNAVYSYDYTKSTAYKEAVFDDMNLGPGAYNNFGSSANYVTDDVSNSVPSSMHFAGGTSAGTDIGVSMTGGATISTPTKSQVVNATQMVAYEAKIKQDVVVNSTAMFGEFYTATSLDMTTARTGIFFYYNNSAGNSRNWTANICDAGTCNSTDTGIAPDNSNWHVYKILGNNKAGGAATYYEFYIDGVLKANKSQGFPTTLISQVGAWVEKTGGATAGASPAFNLDYYYYELNR